MSPSLSDAERVGDLLGTLGALVVVLSAQLDSHVLAKVLVELVAGVRAGVGRHADEALDDLVADADLYELSVHYLLHESAVEARLDQLGALVELRRVLG